MFKARILGALSVPGGSGVEPWEGHDGSRQEYGPQYPLVVVKGKQIGAVLPMRPQKPRPLVKAGVAR